MNFKTKSAREIFAAFRHSQYLAKKAKSVAGILFHNEQQLKHKSQEIKIQFITDLRFS